MPLSYALSTVADFKLYRDIPVNTYDTLIENLIDRATVFIENYLGGRRIKNSGVDVTEFHNGEMLDPKHSIFLKNYPIASITSISFDTGVNFSVPEYDDLDPITDYIFRSGTGEVYILRPFPRQLNGIKVVYKGGFSAIPEDVKLACNMLVAKIFDKRRSQGINREEISDGLLEWGNDEVSAPFGLTPEIKAILDHYKSFVFYS